MSALVNTNILLRSAQPGHPQFSVARNAVASLLDSGEFLFFTAQNAAEFWCVSTRPVRNNGLGYSLGAALAEIGKIEDLLTLLPDAPEVYGEWKRLIAKYEIVGATVHDTRLVAMMNVHGIRRILTFDGADFRRFGEIEVIDPMTVALP